MNYEVKKFFVRAVIFFLPLILIFICLEFYARSLPNSYSLKRDYLLKNSNDIEILVSGSSRSLFGINPEYFSLFGFNLANAGQSYFYDKELILKNFATLPALKCVLIESSDFSLGYELANSPSGWRSYYYWHFWGIKYPNIEKDSRFFSYVMLYTPNKIFDFLMGEPSVKEISVRGWESFNELNILTEQNAKKVIHNLNDAMSQENYFKNIGYLGELLPVLAEADIKVIIIGPPVHKNYFKFIDPVIIRKNSEIWENLCRSGYCSIFDFTNDSRFEDFDFGDSDHLNSVGAEKFSKILNEEVLSGICN